MPSSTLRSLSTIRRSSLRYERTSPDLLGLTLVGCGPCEVDLPASDRVQTCVDLPPDRVPAAFDRPTLTPPTRRVLASRRRDRGRPGARACRRHQADLIEDDVAGMLDGLDGGDQATVVTALIYMYGTKLGALKSRTGIHEARLSRRGSRDDAGPVGTSWQCPWQ